MSSSTVAGYHVDHVRYVNTRETICKINVSRSLSQLFRWGMGTRLHPTSSCGPRPFPLWTFWMKTRPHLLSQACCSSLVLLRGAWLVSAHSFFWSFHFCYQDLPYTRERKKDVTFIANRHPCRLLITVSSITTLWQCSSLHMRAN